MAETASTLSLYERSRLRTALRNQEIRLKEQEVSLKLAKRLVCCKSIIESVENELLMGTTVGWKIVCGDCGEYVYITYCPWCGVKLPEVNKEELNA